METLVIRLPKSKQRTAVELLVEELGGQSISLTPVQAEDMALAFRMDIARKSGKADTESVLRKLKGK